MKTVDVLIKAREYIASGWRRGAYCDWGEAGENGCCYCALGAIGMAQPGIYPSPRLHDGTVRRYPESTRAYEYLMRVVYTEHRVGVSLWNDAPGRTVGEVLAAFDQAIKNAKRRHINGRRTASV